ncbi:DUF72 domain-containing protein [Adhaeribacter radiodurans]|uniref:DUF72 domain-containing protein n=1 Tax=Adhaeribacter radiodurans TaxID=2745197 RepID=A0A7L7LD74_9BACT|nr:DUF72 domain-containing protein [Adhaeribacter radiodurans]QMU30770.1 DUF72 domain-containing protein [Adhaeribacter radiodurans]
MDFGKVSHPEIVNFELPPASPATPTLLAQLTHATYLKPKIYLGCPTWANKSWLGTYYPAGLSAKDFLPYYSQQFNTIELNTTHYRIPDEATVAKWCNAVTPEFKFCPKWPKQISHEQELQGVESATEAFCTALLNFKENLGVSFLQLPPNFGPNQFEVLDKFLTGLPREVPLAVELRHPAWFTDQVAFAELGALLEACEVSTVITDVAGRRNVLHQRLTTATAFIRFNGYLHTATDYARADTWIEQLTTWMEQGLQTLYFFVHYEEIIHSPKLIRYMLEKLAAASGVPAEGAKPIPQPVQGSLFD